MLSCNRNACSCALWSNRKASRAAAAIQGMAPRAAITTASRTFNVPVSTRALKEANHGSKPTASPSKYHGTVPS
jgi:hypothetical protein